VAGGARGFRSLARRTAAARGRNPGFTLLELLVALAILAAAAALTLPAISGGDGVRVEAASRTLAAALRETRSTAMAYSRPSAFTLDLARRTFRAGKQAAPRSLPGELSFTLDTARSELASDQVGSIRFFPDGSSTGGRITISARGAGPAFVDVDWLTGRVRILRATGVSRAPEPPA